MPVDRYKVNDALTALFAGFGTTPDDEVLNDLSHRIADVIDGID